MCVFKLWFYNGSGEQISCSQCTHYHRKSLEEHEALKAELDNETREFEQTLANSEAEKDRLQSEKFEEQVKMQRALNIPESEPRPSAQSSEKVHKCKNVCQEIRTDLTTFKTA